MISVIQTIAHWATSNPVYTETARTRAAEAFADTVACMIAATNEPTVRAVRSASEALISPRGDASVIGGGQAPTSVAALINATAAHALDYDDNFFAAFTHASAVLVPALLATGQAHKKSGSELVDAYLVGLQAQAAVGRGVNPEHYVAGWHSTSTVGTIGCAAAVAYLQTRNPEHIASAMSLAASMASGLKVQHGTSAKALHAGLAARQGIEAATWAANGLSGRVDVLEAPFGFKDLYNGEHAAGWDDLAGFLAQPHPIETVGLAPKRHPCCGSAHPTMDAVLDLKAKHEFSPEQVARVTACVDLGSVRNLNHAVPATGTEGKFSLQYCLALAIARGHIELEDFATRFMTDPQVQQLMPLIQMDLAPTNPDSRIGRVPHSVTIDLHDGRTLRASREYAKGTIADPFTDSDRRIKFTDCCKALADPGFDAVRLLEALLDINRKNDIDFITQAFSMFEPSAQMTEQLQ